MIFKCKCNLLLHTETGNKIETMIFKNNKNILFNNKPVVLC